MHTITKQILAGNIILAIGFGLCACGKTEDAGITRDFDSESEVTQTVQENTEAQDTTEDQDAAENRVNIVIPEQYPKEIYERYGVENVKAYEPLLRKACEIFANEDEMPTWGGELSVDYPFCGGTEHIFKSIGFTIQDFSGDGIPELYIGGLQDASTCDGTVPSEYLDCLYTLKDGEPVMVTYGGCRVQYHHLGGNQFFLSESGGAGSQGYGLLNLSEDGTEFLYEAYYRKEGDEVFYNTSGIWDDYSASADEADLDAFIEKYDHPVDVEMTLFYDLVELH